MPSVKLNATSTSRPNAHLHLYHHAKFSKNWRINALVEYRS